MTTIKTLFIAFAIEDQNQRDLLKGQSRHVRSPFTYIDMSVKKAYDSGWKEKVRTRIKKSNGVIVLVSKNSLDSSGQEWEIKCAREEKKPVLGIWAYSDDRTNIPGINTKAWNDTNISSFIDSI